MSPRFRSFYSITILLLLNACNPYGENGSSDLEFGARADQRSPVAVDQTDDDNSSTGFGGGIHQGTAYQNGGLTLLEETNYSELDKSWAPQWEYMVAYWKMDGNFQDSVGSNHGVGYGNVNTTNLSKIGSHAATFDGSGDYIEVSDALDLDIGTNAFTLNIWTKLEDGASVSGYPTFFEKRTPGGGLSTRQGLYFFYTTGRNYQIELNEYNSVCATSTTTNISDQTWEMLTISRDNSGIKVYVNGALAASTNCSFPINLSNNENATLGFSGTAGSPFLLDDAALWNGAALTADEVALIYSRQSAKFAGTTSSRIIDSKTLAPSWTHINWISPLPFGKELPDGGGIANSESSETYSDLSSDNLMEELVGLWHFNETNPDSYTGGADVKDTSGNDNYLVHKPGHGLPEFNRPGVFDKSLYFSDTTDCLDMSNSITDFQNGGGASEGSVAFWLKRMQSDSESFFIFMFYGGGNGNTIFLQHISSSSFRASFKGKHVLFPSASLKINKWHHFALTWSVNQDEVKAFIDGTQVGTTQNAVSPMTLFPYRMYLSGEQNCNGDYLGYLDEFGLWARALSSSEVQELYRRGANRLKYQVRSCEMPDCSDQDQLTGKGWRGPGGNFLTYFSELYNNTSVSASCNVPQACFASELSRQGEIKTELPLMIFNQFGDDGILQPDGRYFQYRVIMESDDEGANCDGGSTSCRPKLNSVKIGGPHYY